MLFALKKTPRHTHNLANWPEGPGTVFDVKQISGAGSQDFQRPVKLLFRH
jgi:hypothetical protein